jgi:hypothetical protein
MGLKEKAAPYCPEIFLHRLFKFIKSSFLSSFFRPIMILKPVGQPSNKIYQKKHSSNDIWLDQSSSELSDGMPEDFLNYLAHMGLVVGSGLLVIPYKHHYFYDFEDLKGVKTIVNLMKLNHVREVRGFIRKLSELLHHQANFVGCFIDNKTQKRLPDKYNKLPGQLSEMTESYENGIESRIPFVNRMYSFIDSRTNRYLTRRTVTNLLNEFGFHVISMTELYGVTYFYSKKESPSV